MYWCFWYPKYAPRGDNYRKEAELAVFSRKELRISRAPGDKTIMWKNCHQM